MQQCLPFTVLKLPTIIKSIAITYLSFVATVLTVYGIETLNILATLRCLPKLQQCLPFTVLKHTNNPKQTPSNKPKLQQCLPFTVLKLKAGIRLNILPIVATVLTVYGIETMIKANTMRKLVSCNSAYRLRY